jgi:hypothetical protein
MTRFLAIITALAVLFSVAAVWSKAGPAIPLPQVKVAEAIELATKYFLDKETRVFDIKEFKKSEYILTLAQYTRSFGEKRGNTWAWKIRFVHPVANDHSVEYKVTGDRKVVYLGGSE